MTTKCEELNQETTENKFDNYAEEITFSAKSLFDETLPVREVKFLTDTDAVEVRELIRTWLLDLGYDEETIDKILVEK